MADSPEGITLPESELGLERQAMCPGALRLENKDLHESYRVNLIRELSLSEFVTTVGNLQARSESMKLPGTEMTISMIVAMAKSIRRLKAPCEFGNFEIELHTGRMEIS
jgi:hypothetical protein